MAAPRKASTEDMLALRKQGLRNAEIAEKLGVSLVTVRRYIGVQPHERKNAPLEARVPEMLKLREQGYTNAQIAEKMGCHHKAVIRHIGKQPESLDRRRGGTTHADDDEVRKLYESGMSKSAIALKLGISYDAVNRRLQAPSEITPVKPQNAPSEPLEAEVAQVVEVIYATPQRGQKVLPERICDFADTPSWVKKLETLATLAQPESWRLVSPDRASLTPDVEILSSYINTVFALSARAYNAAPESERDRIVYVRDDVVCFHTGLYTPEYRGIYAVFHPNNYVVEDRNEMWLRGFFPVTDRYLLRMPVLPEPYPRSSLPLFDPSKRIYTYTEHMHTRRDGTSRLPDTVRNYWNVELLLETAVELARRKAAADPDGVVACPRVGSGDYLLPLYLTNPDTPDVVALVVITADGYYACKTCLTLNQAYLHARTSGKVTAKWLRRAVEHGGG